MYRYWVHSRKLAANFCKFTLDSAVRPLYIHFECKLTTDQVYEPQLCAVKPITCIAHVHSILQYFAAIKSVANLQQWVVYIYKNFFECKGFIKGADMLMEAL